MASVEWQERLGRQVKLRELRATLEASVSDLEAREADEGEARAMAHAERAGIEAAIGAMRSQ